MTPSWWWRPSRPGSRPAIPLPGRLQCDEGAHRRDPGHALVLLAVFVPVTFFPGATGVIYRQFALTIVFSILVSTFNAITGKPLQSALLLGGGKTEPAGFAGP